MSLAVQPVSRDELIDFVEEKFEVTWGRRDRVLLSVLWAHVDSRPLTIPDGPVESGCVPFPKMGQSKDLASEMRNRGFEMYKIGGVNAVRGLKARGAVQGATQGATQGAAQGGKSEAGKPGTRSRKRARNADYYEATKKERLFKCAVGSVLSGMKPIRKTRALYGWGIGEINLIRSLDPGYRQELEAEHGVSLELQFANRKPLPPMPEEAQDSGSDRESGTASDEEAVSEATDAEAEQAAMVQAPEEAPEEAQEQAQEQAPDEAPEEAPEEAQEEAQEQAPDEAAESLQEELDGFVERHMDIFRRFTNPAGKKGEIPRGGKHAEARAFLLRKLHCERMTRPGAKRVSVGALEKELAEAVNRNKTLAGRADTLDIPPAFPECSKGFR